MANKRLFSSLRTRNSEGSPAYAFDPKHALAQYAATGCLNGSFYASAETQLDELLQMAHEVDAEFVARVAVYSREQAHMKDAPAVLLAHLAQRDVLLFDRIFDRVIDSTRMLRTFVQILRSGVTGRRSFGSYPKRVVRRWFARRTDDALFRGSVGNSPSLADIIHMIHPRPDSPAREALFGYLINKNYDHDALPSLVQEYEAFKGDPTGSPPNVPFAMLTSLPLTREHWAAIARSMPWTALRINLNTLLRHRAYEVDGVADEVAARIRSAEEIRRAKAMPYQLLVAVHHVNAEMPRVIVDALHDALEIAVRNVPKVDGPVHVCPDVSGSMSWPVTGFRGSASSAVMCVDVAALVAAAFLRTNPQATVLPFEDRVVKLRLDPRDTIATNAEKLRQVGGGGTNCSAPLAQLNRKRATGNLVVIVSDNESWVDATDMNQTSLMMEWKLYKRRNPHAKLACLDIVANRTTQALERNDILNLGGFSDRTFEILALLHKGQLTPDHWVGVIENIEI